MSWKKFIAQETKQDYFQQLNFFLQQEKQYNIFPHHKDVFNAFSASPLDQTKVVILGQDPYINPGQAHGLAFSVLPGVDIPPSLRNIYKELKSDLSVQPADHGHLIKWAQQGVLLLNTTLTVREGKSNSHYGRGWEVFSDNALKLVNQLPQPIVYLLWGNNARQKKKLLNNPNHLILEAGHPSPLSCKLFFGCKHFSKCNQFLVDHQQVPIDWKL